MGKKTKYKDYICPKCKSVVHSRVKLEYCICGGKYDINLFEQMLHDACGGLKNERPN